MYFGERSRTGSTLLADALLDMYGRRRTRLSILMRGAQGFGAKHRLRTDRLLTLSEDLPAVAIAIDTRERIAALRHDVQALIDKGLVTLGRTCLVDDRQLPDALTEGDETLKLSAYVGRHERIGSRPAFAAICELLYEQGIAGASVLLGVDGTRDGHRERARFFARNERVPLMILAVGDGARLIGCVAELQRLQPSALFTLERMRVCKRDAGPAEAYGRDLGGRQTSGKADPCRARAAPTRHATSRRDVVARHMGLSRTSRTPWRQAADDSQTRTCDHDCDRRARANRAGVCVDRRAHLASRTRDQRAAAR